MATRVLAVDDDPATRRLLELSLGKWGYDVTVAEDGEQAWQVLNQSDPPRVVILDWMMPGLDGVELCKRIRQQSAGPYSYIMLLTAKTQQEDLVEAFQAGADDYMTKPFHPRELQMRIQAGMRGRGAPDPDRTPLAPPHSPSDASLAGEVISRRYRVETPIASGGMGTVWKGRHVELGTPVAIKFLRREFAQDHTSLVRFSAEARLAARLRSRHAVQIIDFGITEGGLAYLVMEYLRGETLWDAVMRRGPLPPKHVAEVVRQAASGLEKAHALGIIHRDVKPDNILLVKNEEAKPGDAAFVVKLIDFGLAKDLAPPAPDSASGKKPSAPKTRQGLLVGTPNFMTPEYLGHNALPSPMTDLWALAVCAYVGMTGRVPFDGGSLAQIVFNVCVRPRPVPSHAHPHVPPGFDEWFAIATAREPLHRFQTPKELSESLVRLV